MSINLLNFNFNIKSLFSRKKNGKQPEKVSTFSKDVSIEILKDKYQYMLSLKQTNVLILSYPDYLVKYYSNDKSIEGKLIGNIDFLKDYYILFDKLLKKMYIHNTHFLKKDIKINGRYCQFNILELRDDESVYAYIIMNTLFSKNKIINTNEI